MPYTPIETLVGGYLLHLSSSSLLSDTGKVFGISGIVSQALLGASLREKWRWAVIVGLLAGPVIGEAVGLEGTYASDAIAGWRDIALGRGVIAGALVGLGSKLGSGCTSGHFLCGVSRGSPRSLVATATFFVTAMLTSNFFPTSSLATITPAYELAFPKRRSIITMLWTLSAAHLAQQALSSYLVNRPNTFKASKTLPYVLNGLVFSLGLLISGMASPSKVLGFLKPIPPFQHFDPSLAMIVVSGVLPNALHWFNLSEKKPRFSWEKWSVPSRKDIDWRLIVGSALFGAGWGLAGVCPGPAIVGAGKVASAIVAGEAGAIQAGQTIAAYLASMVGGMGLASLI